MIQLKANSELKEAFGQLIKIMKVNVAWNGVFLIINNNLILPGDVRSMFLNLDNKKLTTNVVEIPLNNSLIEEIADSTMLTNVINIVLYAFGKWGVISGLKVEKDYGQLNNMFHSILQEVKIEPSFRDDNFRFFKDGLQITYEDVIQEVLNLRKKETLGDEEEPNTDGEASSDESNNEHKLGLWHNMRWVTEQNSFKKSGKIEKDTAKSRLGNNFYMVDYECSVCGEKLYMVLYPVNQEFLIETDEARVYLARAYACNTCNCFYTPRPGRLLKEGDVYALKFEDDKRAYGDYMELLGASGTRNANYKFNEYESERNKKKENKPETLEEICSELDSMPEKELSDLKDKMDSGFYEQQEVDTYYQQVEKKLNTKNQQKNNMKQHENHTINQDTNAQPKDKNSRQDFSAKSIDELKAIFSELINGENHLDHDNNETKNEKISMVKKQLLQKLKTKYDAHMEVTERMSPKQLTDLKAKIHSEQVLEEEDKKKYLEQIDKVLYRNEEKLMNQKIEVSKNKTYAEISRVIEEISNGNGSDGMKEEALKTINEIKKIKGKKEVEHLISNMPQEMDKKQYQQFCEKLEQYKEIDIQPYQKILDEKYDIAEKQELENLIKKTANKKDRNSLFRLYNQIKEQNFEQRNAEPFLEKIHDKIYAMDEAAIAKICPDIMGVNFAEGLSVYDKISAGMYLPGLKVNMLEALDKRLTKLKMDENQQLVKKLRREIEENIKEYSKLYFYDSRKIMRGEEESKETSIINRALDTYGKGRNKYEMPILIGDSSFLSNGKEGFVLALEHIFYNSLFSSGTINIMDIESVTANTGILSRGIYVNRKGGKKVRIPNSIHSNEWKAFAGIINDFVNYLQEKPESRNIDYLVKEKHEIKCCFRCGYRYKQGNICPKCGNKANS